MISMPALWKRRGELAREFSKGRAGDSINLTGRQENRKMKL